MGLSCKVRGLPSVPPGDMRGDYLKITLIIQRLVSPSRVFSDRLFVISGVFHATLNFLDYSRPPSGPEMCLC